MTYTLLLASVVQQIAAEHSQPRRQGARLITVSAEPNPNLLDARLHHLVTLACTSQGKCRPISRQLCRYRQTCRRSSQYRKTNTWRHDVLLTLYIMPLSVDEILAQQRADKEAAAKVSHSHE
jgi:hypothetical protein